MQLNGSVKFRKHESQAGITLLETMIASLVLVIVTVGLLAVGMFAISTTENQGHLAARTTEYAQDKMEQLLALAYNDPTTDTTVFPATITGGSGLSPGGSSNPNTPVSHYVDYLDVSGNLLASGGGAPAGWFYKRVWQISSLSANLKQITVTTIVFSSVDSRGLTPQSTVTALKTYLFNPS